MLAEQLEHARSNGATAKVVRTPEDGQNMDRHGQEWHWDSKKHSSILFLHETAK